MAANALANSLFCDDRLPFARNAVTLRGNDATRIISIDFRSMSDRRGCLVEEWPGMPARVRRFALSALPTVARNAMALRGNDATRIISIGFQYMGDRRECLAKGSPGTPARIRRLA
jgi:hypothetical protein